MIRQHKLVAFRESCGLSQFSMAVELKMSSSVYEKVERGWRLPSRIFMEKLKIRFPEVDIDDMFFSHLTEKGA